MQSVDILVIREVVDLAFYKYNCYVDLFFLWIKHHIQELLEMAPFIPIATSDSQAESV